MYTQLLLSNDALLHNQSLLPKEIEKTKKTEKKLADLPQLHVYPICLKMLYNKRKKKITALDPNEDKRPFLVYMFYVSNKILL